VRPAVAFSLILGLLPAAACVRALGPGLAGSADSGDTDDGPGGDGRRPSEGPRAEGPRAEGLRGDAPCTLGAFGPPQPVAELNTTSGELAPSISADGLEIFYTRGPNLWRAIRASTASTFFPSAPLFTDLDSPSISSDGLELYVDDGSRVLCSVRSNPSAPFVQPAVVPIVGLASSVKLLGPCLSVDGSTLYLTLDKQAIAVATRDKTGGFVYQRTLSELGTSLGGGFPAVAAGELEIYFERSVSGNTSLHVASRASRDQPFSPPQPLALAKPFAQSYDPALSPDGSTLYFAARLAAGDKDHLWVATRSCQ